MVFASQFFGLLFGTEGTAGTFLQKRRWASTELHCDSTQEIVLCIVTAIRTSVPIYDTFVFAILSPTLFFPFSMAKYST
jgi:hypothetical protein